MIAGFEGKQPTVAASSFVAPNAWLIGDVRIGQRASVWFGAILRGDDGTITDVQISYPMDLTQQMLEYATGSR